MAGKDKVYIDIIVDDKGTTRRVAVDSKKLGVALDDVEKGSKRTGKSAKDLDRNLKGLSSQSTEKKMQELTLFKTNWGKMFCISLKRRMMQFAILR